MYIVTDFVYDLIATLPPILTRFNNKVFVLRFLHIREVNKLSYPLQIFVELVFPYSRTSRLNLSLIVRFFYFIIVAAHYFICLWIWVGTKHLMHDPNVPWLIDHPELGSGGKLYIFVFYWVFTLLATVGYGDFTGGTTSEYLVSIAMEYTGIIVFTILTLFVNQLIASGLSYEKFIGEKFRVLEEWIVKVERCNWPRNLDPSRLVAIRKNLEDAFEYDFNVIIEEFHFYQNLSPHLRSELMVELFGPFEKKFNLFFGELERLFINEIVINLFARTYLPD